MTYELRDVREHFPIRGLIAAAMRRAEKDQTERRILDRLVSRLQSRLEQCLGRLSVADRLHRDLWYQHTCFTTIPPREWATNMRGR
jgi:hypothetical protein